MYPKIGTHKTVDPKWVDDQLMANKGMTDEEIKITTRQAEITTQASRTLNQTVLKGDIKGAQAQERQLKEQFQSYSIEEKQYMYNLLNSDQGVGRTFRYRLATAQRERLLTVLNPEHVTSPAAAKKMMESAKATKTNELNAGGLSIQKDLNSKIN